MNVDSFIRGFDPPEPERAPIDDDAPVDGLELADELGAQRRERRDRDWSASVEELERLVRERRRAGRSS